MFEELINDAIYDGCIQSKPIEEFTIEQLKELAEKAKKNNLLLTLHAEHSNFHQGVLVNLVNRDIMDSFVKYM
jgi:ABC-type uncharacterized transport system substrate-binding protein